MSETITVCSKLPNGLILQLSQPIDIKVAGPNGEVRVEKIPRKFGPKYTLNGTGTFRHDEEKAAKFGGYALTHGIPADFWRMWLEQYRDSDLVKNKIVFAHAKPKSAAAMAKENAKTKSGLEPLDPDKPPKDARGVTRAIR